MHEIQILLSQNAKQEQLKREQKRRQAFYTVRYIFTDDFGITNVNHQHTILDQLVYVIDRF